MIRWFFRRQSQNCKQIKKIAAVCLSLAVIATGSVLVFAQNKEAVIMPSEGQISPRTYVEPYSTYINGTSLTRVFQDGWVDQHDDTVIVTLSDDGSYAGATVYYILTYGSQVFTFTLNEGQSYSRDCGPGQTFQIDAKFLHSGETGTITGTVASQPN